MNNDSKGMRSLEQLATKIRAARTRARAATTRDEREAAETDVRAHEARFFDDWSLLQTKEVTAPKEST